MTIVEGITNVCSLRVGYITRTGPDVEAINIMSAVGTPYRGVWLFVSQQSPTRLMFLTNSKYWVRQYTGSKNWMMF